MMSLTVEQCDVLLDILDEGKVRTQTLEGLSNELHKKF
jgi:uncharacterized protein (DUF1778 family)